MKLTIRNKSGVEIEFEGDQDEFERFAQFLGDAPGGLVDPSPFTIPEKDDGPEVNAGDDDGGVRHGVDLADLQDRMAHVGAASDLHRATVIAAATVEAGWEGITSTDLVEVFQRLGFRVPPTATAPLYNAKQRGLLFRTQNGLWRPTAAGEAYAREGERAAQLVLNQGGDA